MAYSSTFSSSLDSSTSTTTAVQTSTADETSSSSLAFDMTIETSPLDDSDGLAATLGGEAVALGEDTLTTGSVSAEMDAEGAVTTLNGTADMLAASEAPEGDTAQALTDSFAEVSDGAEFVFTYNVETDSGQQTQTGSAATSTSTTGVTAYNLELSIGGDDISGDGTATETDPPATTVSGDGTGSSPSGDDTDSGLDGNIATVEFDATAFGEDTFVSADAFALAVEDELSASAVLVELATG